MWVAFSSLSPLGDRGAEEVAEELGGAALTSQRRTSRCRRRMKSQPLRIDIGGGTVATFALLAGGGAATAVVVQGERFVRTE